MELSKRNLDDLADIAWWIKGYISCSEINARVDRLFVSDHVESLKIARELIQLEIQKEKEAPLIIKIKDKYFLLPCPKCGSNVEITGSECYPDSGLLIECTHDNCDMMFLLSVNLRSTILKDNILKDVLVSAWNHFCTCYHEGRKEI